MEASTASLTLLSHLLRIPHGSGPFLWPFLGQLVPSTIKFPVFMWSSKLLGVIFRRAAHAVTGPIDCDSRDGDRWLSRQLRLDRGDGGIARYQSIAMTIRVDDDFDEIWIIERFRTPLKGRIVKIPIR